MKVRFVAGLLALSNFSSSFFLSVDAFTTTSISSPHSMATLSDKRRYHHMGDLDHEDFLPEEGHFFPNPTKLVNEEEELRTEQKVVLFDDAAVALDDEAWELAMKSMVAFFAAAAITFVGPGIFKPRPVLAMEPVVIRAESTSTLQESCWRSGHSWDLKVTD